MSDPNTHGQPVKVKWPGKEITKILDKGERRDQAGKVALMLDRHSEKSASRASAGCGESSKGCEKDAV
jgi:hypothetical protein